jgi:hypothetical protein
MMVMEGNVKMGVIFLIWKYSPKFADLSTISYLR